MKSKDEKKILEEIDDKLENFDINKLQSSENNPSSNLVNPNNSRLKSYSTIYSYSSANNSSTALHIVGSSSFSFLMKSLLAAINMLAIISAYSLCAVLLSLSVFLSERLLNYYFAVKCKDVKIAYADKSFLN